MEDIANLVTYDQAHTVDIKHPKTGAGVGISVSVVSEDSEVVARAMRVLDAERWQSVFNSDDKKLSPKQVVEFTDKAEREKLIAAIVAWNFGGKSFGDLGADPDCTEENKRYFITHPNASWIRAQLAQAVADLGNFTPKSNPPAKSTSPK